MNILTVSMFGHREIDNLNLLDKRLFPLIKEIMKENTYVSFLLGRNGEFDEYTASIIKRAQKEIGKEKSEITLVLPYEVANLEYYERYYDSIIIPENLHSVHPKVAITLRNRWMIEHSDVVIVYVERDMGGAYTAMKYAKQLNKRIININLDSDL